MGPILPPAPVATFLAADGGCGHPGSRRPPARRSGGQRAAGGRQGVARSTPRMDEALRELDPAETLA